MAVRKRAEAHVLEVWESRGVAAQFWNKPSMVSGSGILPQHMVPFPRIGIGPKLDLSEMLVAESFQGLFRVSVVVVALPLALPLSSIVAHPLQCLQHDHRVASYDDHAQSMLLTARSLFDRFIEHDVQEDLPHISFAEHTVK